jgi:peptidoglycan/LPS O-acetylase OafA/YrhL
MKLTYAYGDEWLLQPFFASLMAVDIFFVLGGFLLSYSFFEHQKKNPSKNIFAYVLKKILNRYIRINTSFIIVMLMAVTTVMFINDTSQFIMFEDIEGNCKKFWWRNLLFIQNLFPFKDICMTWSW